MEETAILFVKSEKFEHAEWSMPHHDHWCSAGYRATKTDLVLSEEDRKAVEALERSGLNYKVVDLSLASATMRLKAKLEGVNATPTMIYKGRKVKGLKQILETLENLLSVRQE
ncbi:MAG: hypothetical protein QXF44_01780 [Candidatus Bathyarchaeia archaeon]